MAKTSSWPLYAATRAASRAGQPRSRTRARAAWASTALTALALAGCAINKPYLEPPVQLSIDATPAPGGTPYCLHQRAAVRYWYLYSDTELEAWVTEGSCAANGPPRRVDHLTLSWRFKYGALESRQCVDTDRCRISERHVGIGKAYACTASTAQTSDATAHLTTDQVNCP